MDGAETKKVLIVEDHPDLRIINDHIVKPFNFEQLRQKIEEHIL